MLYEFRVYEPHEGKAEAMLQRFREHTLRLFPAHGIEVVGLFAVEPNDGRIAYLTRFADDAARRAAWAGFGSDPEWQQIKAASETDGPLLRQQNVTLLASLPAGFVLG